MYLNRTWKFVNHGLYLFVSALFNHQLIYESRTIVANCVQLVEVVQFKE